MTGRVGALGAQTLKQDLGRVAGFVAAMLRAWSHRPRACCHRILLRRCCSIWQGSILTVSSPRRTQLEPGFVERGTLRLRRLRRAAVIEVIPWNGCSDSKPQVLPPK
jgi:hypothetical protein